MPPFVGTLTGLAVPGRAGARVGNYAPSHALT